MNKRSIIWLIALLLLAAVAACGATRAAEDLSYDVAPTGAPQEAPAPEAAEDRSFAGAPGTGQNLAQDGDMERMVIHTAQLSLVVEDVEATLPQVRTLVQRMEGYIAQSTSYRTATDRLEATVVLRVPAERFNEALDQIRALAWRVTREDLMGEDVTDQYVDLQARLNALEATEEQLTTLLAEVRQSEGNAQEKAQAILAIYDELTTIRSQIEQIQGQMHYLEEMSAMGTITVELRPREPEVEQPVVEEGFSPGRIARQAARTLVSILQGIAAFLINFVVVVLPVLLLIALPVGLVAWGIRRLLKAQQEKKEDS